MKIAIIHRQYRKRGGTEAYLFDLLFGFLQAGDQVDVFVYQIDKNTPVPESCQIHKTNLLFIPKKIKKYAFTLWPAKQFNKNHYDLSLSLISTLSQDMSVYVGVHAAYMKTKRRSFMPNLIDRLECFLEKKSFKNSKWIVASSNKIKNEIQNFYTVDTKKIVVIYPPIDTNKFNSSLRIHRDTYRSQFNFDPKKIYFLFPSTGHERKGLPELVEAFSNLSDTYQLIVVGSSPRMKLPPSAQYVGFANEMEKLYVACDFTILPSKYDPFGLVVSESLQCQTPVIISRQVGAGELLDSNEGVILDTINPTTIINTIQGIERRHFKVEPDFAKRHGLSIEQHINKIKALLSTCSGS